jgi:hypothetical protein
MIGSYYLKVTSIGIKGSNYISKLAWNTPFGIMFLPNTVELHGYGKPRVNVGDIVLIWMKAR